MSNQKPSKSPQTIAEQLEAFERLIAWFDSDEFELEAALNKYTQAEKLAEAIEKQLASVKNDVDVLKQKFSD